MDVSEFDRHDSGLNIQHEREQVLERIKSQVVFAEVAIKGLILTNGGAIVGLFTFAGHRTTVEPDLADQLLWAFAIFSGGTVLALLACFFGFLAQRENYEGCLRSLWKHQARSLGQWREDGEEFRFWSKARRYATYGMFALTGSLASFVIGAGVALIAGLL
jgi:hypothetical protein